MVYRFVLSARNQRVVGSNPTRCVCPKTIVSLNLGVVNGYPAGILFLQCSDERLHGGYRWGNNALSVWRGHMAVLCAIQGGPERMQHLRSMISRKRGRK